MHWDLYPVNFFEKSVPHQSFQTKKCTSSKFPEKEIEKSVPRRNFCKKGVPHQNFRKKVFPITSTSRQQAAIKSVRPLTKIIHMGRIKVRNFYAKRQNGEDILPSPHSQSEICCYRKSDQLQLFINNWKSEKQYANKTFNQTTHPLPNIHFNT